MKTFLLFVFAINAAASLGSGPYLPSGWKPKGPAFLLPSEFEKVSENTQTDGPSEAEASGSEFLREYGPPQPHDVFQALTRQALPDLSTEKPFVVEYNAIEDQFTAVSQTEATDQVRSNVFQSVDDKIDEVNTINIDTENVEESDEEKLEESLVVDNESNKIVVDTTQRIDELSLSVSESDTNLSVTESSVVETDKIVGEENVNVTEENITKEETIDEGLKQTDESNTSENVVSNIKEDTSEEIDVRSEENSKSVKAEEVSLGFKEYGPPKSDSDEETKSKDVTENNETRRRRFLSKYSVNKH